MEMIVFNRSNSHPTLLEMDDVRPDTFYSVIDGLLVASPDSNTADYFINIALLDDSDIQVNGVITDGEGNKLGDIHHESGSSTRRFEVFGTVTADGISKMEASVSYCEDSVSKSSSLVVNLTYMLDAESHELIHPTKREPGEPPLWFGEKPSTGSVWDLPPCATHIVTALNRNPYDVSDIDYICCWGEADPRHPYFGLPGKGLVKGPDNAIFLPDDPMLSASCILYEQKNGGGLLTACANGPKLLSDRNRPSIPSLFGNTYQISAGDIKFSCSPYDPSTAQYEFLGAWQRNELVFDEKWFRDFDYYLHMILPFEVPGWPSPMPFTIVVTSIAKGPESALYDRTVMPVRMMGGCVAADAMILTPDGERRIDRLGIGDTVTTRNGTAKLTNLVTGFEAELTVVTTGCGVMRLTADHPVLTEGGFVPAARLAASDRVVTTDGTTDVRSINTIEYHGNVCNIETDGTFIISGMIVGDYKKQNEVM